MRKWLAVIAPLLLCAILLTGGARAEITASESITVSGDHFHLGGADLTAPLVGVCDTTLIPYAIWAHVGGNDAYWGMNQNFPGPEGDEGDLDCNNLMELFHQYFWLCENYDITLLRTGAYDGWAGEIMHEAWRDHPTEFYEVLDTMLHEASEHNVYVELVLAGYSYNFGVAGNVLTVGTAAWSAFIAYESSVMHHFNSSSAANSALFGFDVFNEPDGDPVNTAFWANDQLAFHDWATNVSANLCPQTPHIVDMGTGIGTLFTVDWHVPPLMGYDPKSELPWPLINMTFGTGFDVAHWHIYGSAEDASIIDRIDAGVLWATLSGKPNIVGELGKNDVYPIVRWTWYEAQLDSAGGEAWVNLALRGTAGYPFIGVIPGDEEPGGTETGPETYPQPDGGGGDGGDGDDIPIIDELEGVPLQYFAAAGGLLIAAAVFTTKHPKLLFILGAVLLGYALFEGGWL